MTPLETKIQELLNEIEVVQFYTEPVVQRKLVDSKMQELALWVYENFKIPSEHTNTKFIHEVDSVMNQYLKGRSEELGIIPKQE